MYSIVARLGILLLAVVAMVAVAWPSDVWLDRFWFPPDFPAGYRIWFWALHVGNMAAAAGLVIALLIAVRPGVDESARPLAVALCCVAALWGLWTAPELAGTVSAIERFSWVLLMAFTVSFCVALIQFVTRYPHPFSRDELEQLLTRSSRSGVHHRAGGSVIAGLHQFLRWFNRAPHRLSLSILGAGRYRGLIKSYQSVSGRLDHRSNIQHLNVRLAHTLYAPWKATAILIAILAALIMLPVPDLIHALVLVIVLFLGVMPLAIAPSAFRIGFAMQGPDTQSNALWIMAGLSLGIAVMFSVAWVAFYLVPVNAFVRLGIALLGTVIGWMIFTVCLVPALFMRGALGSGLIIRGSMFVGLFGVILAFVFALVENLITLLISDFVDLPDGTGLVVSGGVAAMMFAPLWKRVNRWLESFVDVERTK